MVGVADSLEQLVPAEPISSAGGLRVEIAPDREGDAEVVDDGRPAEQRGPPEGDAEAALDDVVLASRRPDVQRWDEPAGDA